MKILEKLRAIEKSKVIYNICFRNAGVGFMFYDERLVKNNDFKTGLTLEHYYPTFTKAVREEYKRLSITPIKEKK